MFAAAMVSAGKADVCIAGNLSSTANVLRAGLRIIGLQPGCKTLSSIFLMLPQYSGPALGFADCSVVCTADGGAAGGYRACQCRNLARHHRRRAARGDAVVFQ